MGKVRVAMGGAKLWATGSYEGTVTAVEIAQKDGKEFPTLKVDISIVDGDESMSKSRWFSFNPKAAWALQALLETLGVEFEVETSADDAGAEVESLVFDPEDLVGKQVIVALAVGEYKGRKQNEISDIYSAE